VCGWSGLSPTHHLACVQFALVAKATPALTLLLSLGYEEAAQSLTPLIPHIIERGPLTGIQVVLRSSCHHYSGQRLQLRLPSFAEAVSQQLVGCVGHVCGVGSAVCSSCAPYMAAELKIHSYTHTYTHTHAHAHTLPRQTHVTHPPNRQPDTTRHAHRPPVQGLVDLYSTRWTKRRSAWCVAVMRAVALRRIRLNGGGLGADPEGTNPGPKRARGHR
jgi:hypothetical protein